MAFLRVEIMTWGTYMVLRRPRELRDRSQAGCLSPRWQAGQFLRMQGLSLLSGYRRPGAEGHFGFCGASSASKGVIDLSFFRHLCPAGPLPKWQNESWKACFCANI